jgi:hypothetical protein
MSDFDDEPKPVNVTMAAQVHDARLRGAYSIEVLAGLASVEPAVVLALENGGPINDTGALDRVLDVLGLRRDSRFYR